MKCKDCGHECGGKGKDKAEGGAKGKPKLPFPMKKKKGGK